MLKKKLKQLGRMTYSMKLFYIRSRNELPFILNSRKLNGEGAEIGVFKGAFSEYLLRHWNGRKLFSVDPWREFGDEYSDICNLKQEEHNRVHDDVKQKLSAFGDRSVVFRGTSEEFCQTVSAQQLDFAYIDAQHHYEAAKQDINLWYPKIRPGGILAGHDYLDGDFDEGRFGVKSAVDEFVREKGLTLLVSKEPEWPSWFILT